MWGEDREKDRWIERKLIRTLVDLNLPKPISIFFFPYLIALQFVLKPKIKSNK